RERRGLETPVLLEIVRAGAALATAVIENAQTALAAATHQLPILEIVRRQLARVDGVSRVIRQHFIAEIKAKYAAERSRTRIDDSQHLAAISENLGQLREVSARKWRRAVTMDIVRIKCEKTV